MKLSIPYPAHPFTSFWGTPTAESNFCEEDYVITRYIAEFVNTLTNITYIIYSAHGLYRLQAHQRLTWTSTLPLLGLLAVGVFSAAFHMTLLHLPQLADDLSMVFPTAFVLLKILTFRAQNPTKVTIAFAATLLIIYTIYLNVNKPIIHIMTFGIMVHFIRVNVFRLLKERVPDPQLRRKLWRTAMFGAVSFASGFGLWLVDRFACPTLTKAKRSVGMPWAFLLELHGWWHILTGIGAYVFIILAGHLTSDDAANDPEDAFGWPARLVGQTFTAETKKSQVNGSVRDEVKHQ